MTAYGTCSLPSESVVSTDTEKHNSTARNINSVKQGFCLRTGFNSKQNNTDRSKLVRGKNSVPQPSSAGHPYNSMNIKCPHRQRTAGIRPQSAGNLSSIEAMERAMNNYEQRRNFENGAQKLRQLNQRPYSVSSDRQRPHSGEAQSIMEIKKNMCRGKNPPKRDEGFKDRELPQSKQQQSPAGKPACRPCGNQNINPTLTIATKSKNGNQQNSLCQFNSKCSERIKLNSNNPTILNDRVVVHKGSPMIIEVRSPRLTSAKAPNRSLSFNSSCYEVDRSDTEDYEFPSVNSQHKDRNSDRNAGDNLLSSNSIRNKPLQNFQRNSSTNNSCDPADQSKQDNTRQLQSNVEVERRCVDMGQKIRSTSQTVDFTKDDTFTVLKPHISQEKISKCGRKACRNNRLSLKSSVTSLKPQKLSNKILSDEKSEPGRDSEYKIFEVSNTDTIVIKPGKTTLIEVRPSKDQNVHLNKSNRRKTCSCGDSSSESSESNDSDSQSCHILTVDGNTLEQCNGGRDVPTQLKSENCACKESENVKPNRGDNESSKKQSSTKVCTSKHCKKLTQNCENVCKSNHCQQQCLNQPTMVLQSNSQQMPLRQYQPLSQYQLQHQGEMFPLQQYQPQPTLQQFQLPQRYPVPPMAPLYQPEPYQQYQNAQLQQQPQVSSYQCNQHPLNVYQNDQPYTLNCNPDPPPGQYMNQAQSELYVSIPQVTTETCSYPRNIDIPTENFNDFYNNNLARPEYSNQAFTCT